MERVSTLRGQAIRTVRLVLWGAGLVAATASMAHGGVVAGIAPDLLTLVRAQPGQILRVIVQTDGTLAATLEPSIRLLGGTIHRTLAALNMRVVDLPGGSVGALAQLQGVIAVSPDRAVAMQLDLAMSAVGARSRAVRAGNGGAGVTLAVLGAGIAPHPDLDPARRIVGWLDLVQGLPAPYDDHGHGTHVAGIMGGNGL